MFQGGGQERTEGWTESWRGELAASGQVREVGKAIAERSQLSDHEHRSHGLVSKLCTSFA